MNVPLHFKLLTIVLLCGAVAIAPLRTLAQMPDQTTSERILALSQQLNSPDVSDRIGAAFALGMMGEVAKAAIPQLIFRLDDPDPDVRRNAAEALGRMGEPAKVAIPQLVYRLSDDPSEEVRSYTAEALRKLGYKPW